MAPRRNPLPHQNDYVVLASDDNRLVRHNTILEANNEMNRLAKANPGKSFKAFAQVAEKFEPLPQIYGKFTAPPFIGSEFIPAYKPYACLIDWTVGTEPKFPRYFTSSGWGGGSLLVRLWGERDGEVIDKNGEVGAHGDFCLDTSLALVKDGTWREVSREKAIATMGGCEIPRRPKAPIGWKIVGFREPGQTDSYVPRHETFDRARAEKTSFKWGDEVYHGGNWPVTLTRGTEIIGGRRYILQRAG